MTAPAPLRLRLGAPADIIQVERIEQCCFSDPWPRSALLAELQPDWLRAPIVAASEDRVLGYLMAWRIVDQLHILNLAVAPEEQGQGIGSALLLASLTGASGRGLIEATLEVRQGNVAAQRFYRRHGFEPRGRRPRYYADSGEAAIIMTRRLWKNEA
jgi:ribosomal-protein-alanine N-acetyltransferase